MKRMLNQKRRPSTPKKGLKPRRRYFKTIQSKKKKKSYIPANAPYNSNEYLIENNSSPFFDENDEDIDPNFVPSSLYLIKETENLIDESALDFKKISSYSTQVDSFPLEEHLDIDPPYYL